MEFRHAIMFASRTARLSLNTTSQCRALGNPCRLLSTTRALLSPDDELSGLPPRPPTGRKASWIDLPSTRSTAPPTTTTAASSSSAPSPFSNPLGPSTSDFLNKVIWDMDEFKVSNNVPSTRRPVEMRNLRPSTGRTIERSGSVDVARAFKMLNIACNQNKVARDFSKQRFHERPGLRRKRLKSERWRARFKIGFRATVKRVSELRAQGW